MEKVNGEKFKILQNAIDLKEHIALIKKMGMEHLLGKVEIYLQAITLMMKDQVMVKCTGLTVQFIKENGIKVYNMEEV